MAEENKFILNILRLTGADDQQDAVRVLEDMNTFLNDVRKVTKGDSFESMLESLQNSANICKSISELADNVPAAEAVGAARAWKESHEELPKVRSELESAKKANRERDMASLIAQGQADGKLTPAMVEYWKDKDPDSLKGFLAVASRVVPTSAQQPSTAPVTTPAAGPAATVTPTGQRYEDLAPAARASLKKSDPAMFNALHDDWERRGSPRNAA